ncbi:MAG: type II CRISPR-associated endonuclease Cas1 [Erysipelotrichales bacterium]|nr:type II CRISPR-associated endonuclease Cas1 [Erysipelotrichales bacterium]
MGFRTVVIKCRAKIETRLNWLVIRSEEEKIVHLSEIGTLIIESTACAITTQALCVLARNNISVIFCDEKHLPYGGLSIFYGHHLSSGQIKRQSQWENSRKDIAWQEIIRQKIYWQKKVLEKYGKEESANLLSEYINKIEVGDETNREGHASKVYFNALLGSGFGRRTENEINGALNYGYSIIMSSVAREIAAAGYVTQLGIHHINEFNQFNLACDIMEVFRPLVDAYVLQISNFEKFKNLLSAILTTKAKMAGKEQFLDNAIAIFTRSVLKFMDGNEDIVKIDKFILEEGNEL